MIIPSRAIVLNRLRYGDSSLIVHLYTEQMGRQTVFVKGLGTKKSAMRTALFQPLQIVEAELRHRTGRQMQRIANVRVLQPLDGVLFNPVKSSIALFISEILMKSLHEEEHNGPLFDFLLHAVQTLDLMESGTANFHLMFLVHYTRYLGCYLNTNSLSEIDIEAHDMLNRLLQLSFEHLDELQISRKQRNALTRQLLTYYGLHVEGFGRIKSFEVLQDIFTFIG